MDRRPNPVRPIVTGGRRWRARRDLVIALAHREGLSQRFLADVFDLSRARVAGIVAEVAARAATSRGGVGDGPAAERPRSPRRRGPRRPE